MTKAEHRTQRTYRKLAFFCGLPVIVLMVMVATNWKKLEGANSIRTYRSASILDEQHFSTEHVTNRECAESSVQIQRSADPNLVTITSGAIVEWHEFVALEAQHLEDDGWIVERRVSTPAVDLRARWGFEARRGDDLVTLYTHSGSFGFASATCVAANDAVDAALRAEVSEPRPDSEWSALPATEVAGRGLPRSPRT